MPETSAKIAAQLNTALPSFEECAVFGHYPCKNKVTDKPEILFARLDAKRGGGKG